MQGFNSPFSRKQSEPTKRIDDAAPPDAGQTLTEGGGLKR